MREGSEWHYLAGGGALRYPRRHIFVDTEARTTRTARGHTQSWRCGVTITHHQPKGRKPREVTRAYTDSRLMWSDITEWIPRRERAVLWAHNLGYDLRVSRALTILPSLRWRLIGHHIAQAGTWLIWRRGDQSLVMTDSTSILPTSVAQLAKSFVEARPELPLESDGPEVWARRCLRDTQILRDAVLAYLNRIEAHGLGGWQLTGTGQAWAAFRARWLTHRMLVHHDPDARAAERRAMWTGRCEAYWRGRLRGVRVDEWDMTLAYPRIALAHSVPVELAGAFGPDADITRMLGRDGYATLAEVSVRTDEPLVPMERDGRVCWPVGEFRTILWDPELRLLLDRGAQVTVHRGWSYRAEPALQSWAQWIMDEMAAPDDQVPAWWRLVIKHWGRALIGRMAMTYREWEYVGRMSRSDVRRATYVDSETGLTGELVQVGHDVWTSTTSTEWASAMPAITGWVQSQARVALTRILIDAGPRVALYADTDSVITSAEHHDLMSAIAARHPDAGLRLKRSWDGIEIRGPRQVVTGTRVRVSGIPIGAQRLPDGTLVGEVWQSLSGAMTARTPGVVRIDARRWHLRAVDQRRADGPDGWTLPLNVSLVD